MIVLSSQIIKRAQNGQFSLIAEIGVNHFDIAKKMSISPLAAAKLMIDKAHEAGVHAVKFQSYKAEKLASKNSPSYWDTSEESTQSQYELFKKYDSFSFEHYKELSEYSKEIGIEFLSTAFDFESADYLAELMNVYKISSSDLTNHPFIVYQAKKNKPILLSVGASDKDEIDEAVNLIKANSSQPIVLLHCILEYPTPYHHANLNRITSLRNNYPDLIIGYSDHTKPDLHADVIKTAFNLGAIVVEKHFTLDKTLPGNDHYHAMDEKDAKRIIHGVKFVKELQGSHEIEHLESEIEARNNARRSIVSNKHIKKGELVTHSMLSFKRPGIGIPPSHIDRVIGMFAAKDISNDEIIKYEMLSNKPNKG